MRGCSGGEGKEAMDDFRKETWRGLAVTRVAHVVQKAQILAQQLRQWLLLKSHS